MEFICDERCPERGVGEPDACRGRMQQVPAIPYILYFTLDWYLCVESSYGVALAMMISVPRYLVHTMTDFP